MPGRKPKPTNLKLLQGTARKHRLNKNEPMPDPCIPDMPAHLSEPARKEWSRLAPELESLGLLSNVDRNVFAAYCQAYGRWVMAETEIARLDSLVDRTPRGMAQQHAYVGIANRAMELMNRFGVELGLSPSSRSKVTPAKKDKPKKTGFGAL